MISFDESFNLELQKEQMDFIVKYFSKNIVVSRYLTLSFLGHTRADDLKRNFEEVTKDLDKKMLAQVSMDGSNVNWKMYDKLMEERGENEQLPGLINVGSCGLHVVNWAFRGGTQKMKWAIDSILRELFKLLDESPAKREDYSAITRSNKFPLPFCGNRWVEDKKVAERALQIWPAVMVYVKKTIKKPKEEVQVSYSLTTIRSAYRIV